MSHVGQVAHGVDKGRHVGSGVKQRRILLRKNLAKFGAREFRSDQRGGHGCDRVIKEGDFMACCRVNQGWKKSGIRMGEREGEMLNMVADSTEGGDACLLGEGVGCEC